MEIKSSHSANADSEVRKRKIDSTEPALALKKPQTSRVYEGGIEDLTNSANAGCVEFFLVIWSGEQNSGPSRGVTPCSGFKEADLPTFVLSLEGNVKKDQSLEFVACESLDEIKRTDQFAAQLTSTSGLKATQKTTMKVNVPNKLMGKDLVIGITDPGTAYKHTKCPFIMLNLDTLPCFTEALANSNAAKWHFQFQELSPEQREESEIDFLGMYKKNPGDASTNFEWFNNEESRTPFKLDFPKLRRFDENGDIIPSMVGTQNEAKKAPTIYTNRIEEEFTVPFNEMHVFRFILCAGDN